MIRPTFPGFCFNCAFRGGTCGLPEAEGDAAEDCSRWEGACYEEYREWIKDNVEDDGYGKCEEITQAMVAHFHKTLKRVRGFYYCTAWGERMHWWCVTVDDGTIVDPTAAQFPSKGQGIYEEVDESKPETIPTGKCPNCGGWCYEGRYICSDKCATEYEAYLNGHT